ncbi:MAG: proton-conducting membrane transporter, partial [Calditrichia bacterium]|nr:proton-conducting membrane transporter [Calditrichia bacterium]
FFSLLIEMKQFPANGWAWYVYEASHPGIAGLISAAGTAAVFFALYKVMPLGNELWYNLIAAIGIITFVASNIMGLRQKNTNRLLGYSSIAQMGLLLGAMGLGFLFGGIGKDFQFIIFVLFINHFIAKAGLFWIAGIIKKSDYKEWGVLRKKPCLLFIFGLFVLGLIGFPPFPGFWGKWSLIMELASNQKFVYIWLILIGSLLETVYMLRWFGHAVKGESEETSEASEKKFSILEKLIPVALLATVYVVLGYFTGIKTNSSVMMTFIPIAAASGFLLLDWLPAKIKGVLAIAAVSAYAVYLFPQLNGYPLFFNLLFLSGSVVLLIATLNRKKLSV